MKVSSLTAREGVGYRVNVSEEVSTGSVSDRVILTRADLLLRPRGGRLKVAQRFSAG